MPAVYPQIVKARRYRSGLGYGLPKVERNQFFQKQLLGFWVPGRAPGPLFNLVSSSYAGVATGNPTSRSGPNGFEFNGAASTYWTVNPSGMIVGGNPGWTIIAGIRTTTTSNATIYTERNSTSGNDLIEFNVGFAAAGRFSCLYRNDSGTLINPGNGPVVNDGKFHVIAATFDNTAVQLYVDGIASISTAWGGANNNWTDAGITSVIGADTTNGSFWSGGLQFLAIAKLAWNAADHLSFALDPYQFLTFPDDRLASIFGGKVGGTLFFQTALANAATVGSLTKQSNKLANANASVVGLTAKQDNKPALASTTVVESLVRLTGKKTPASTPVAGSLTRQTNKAAIASTTVAASILSNIRRNVVALASTTVVASLTRQIGKLGPASTSVVGLLSRQTNKQAVVSTPVVGLLTRMMFAPFTASTPAAGLLTRLTSKTFPATTNVVGTTVAHAIHSLVLLASSTAAGLLTRQTNKQALASTPTAGLLVRLANKVLPASTNAVGTMTEHPVHLLSLLANTTVVASLVRLTNKQAPASATVVESLARAIVRGPVVALTTVAGLVAKLTSHKVPAASTPAVGLMTPSRVKPFAVLANATVVASLVRLTGKPSVASTTVISTAKRAMTPGSYVAITGAVGVAARRTIKALTAAVTAVGTVATRANPTHISFIAITNAVGTVSRVVGVPLLGVSTAVAVLTRQFPRNFIASTGAIGSFAFRKASGAIGAAFAAIIALFGAIPALFIRFSAPATTTALFDAITTEVYLSQTADNLSQLRLAVTFIDELANLPADPSTVILHVLPPGSPQVDYTAQVVRDDTGKYHYDLLLNLPGQWLYKWQGKGVIEFTTPDQEIMVNSSRFTMTP